MSQQRVAPESRGMSGTLLYCSRSPVVFLAPSPSLLLCLTTMMVTVTRKQVKMIRAIRPTMETAVMSRRGLL